ncbi:AraC family transcriptional regulator, partial [Gluconobacter sphaericus]
MNHQSDIPSLLALAAELAPRSGYNATSLPSVRILRSETILEDVPVLYRPGAVFVLQGFKQGFLNGEIYRYDAEHYLAVSVPVPFRMASQASPAQPLIA